MTRELDHLAEAHGIALSFRSETGEERQPSDTAKRKILGALGVPAETDDEVRQSLADLEHPRCYRPGWLDEGRAWGVTCQLYGLRTQRNWGIGDFADLARLAEIMAGSGADFVGVNPLHALFYAEPRRFGPYAPSSRRFLNPIYIAVDRLDGTPPDRSALEAARNAALVDYETVAQQKHSALETVFVRFRREHLGTGSESGRAFDDFRRTRGKQLEEFALFEALSEYMVRQGIPCGWHNWPEEYRDKNDKAVVTFREQNGDRLLYHMWLQWVAAEQLAAAQRRALAAGMRIGLYLDLAVGVAPDGADTWSEPGAVLRGVRIGAPPDALNDKGQDWGLAPVSPKALTEDHGRVFREVLKEAMGVAGAIRIDHVMSLMRLYLIADGLDGSDGVYVHYPFRQMLDIVGRASQDARAFVIGEDLGTVPPNFRETMKANYMLGYRVLVFEREHDGSFRQPQHYEREAMACIATHDLPTLSGWWSGYDIDDREKIGMDDAEGAERGRQDRAEDRRRVVRALNDAGLLPESLAAAGRGETDPPDTLNDDINVAVSRFLARTPCRLVAIQLEDLAGMRDRANLPGTMDEYPNWRQRLPLTLEELPQTSTYQAVTQAVAKERPRPSD